jgi:hypothetical protein
MLGIIQRPYFFNQDLLPEYGASNRILQCCVPISLSLFLQNRHGVGQQLPVNCGKAAGP